MFPPLSSPAASISESLLDTPSPSLPCPVPAPHALAGFPVTPAGFPAHPIFRLSFFLLSASSHFLPSLSLLCSQSSLTFSVFFGRSLFFSAVLSCSPSFHFLPLLGEAQERGQHLEGDRKPARALGTQGVWRPEAEGAGPVLVSPAGATLRIQD